MKNILLFMFVISIGYSQTRTPIYQLPQWSTGDTLKSGTANDSSVSNFSLNNLGSRIDKILGKNIDSTGNFRAINGTGTGNLEITAGAGGSSIGRIILNDSLYSTYNWQTTGNLLVGNNGFFGGYITVDSIITTATFTVQNNLSVLGNIINYGSGGITASGGDLITDFDLVSGTAGSRSGSVHLESLGSTGEPSGMTVMPVEADYNDTLYLPHKTGANRKDTVVTMNGEQNLYSYLGHTGQSGTATVGADDSVQVTFTGFTSSGIVMLNYIGGNATRTKIPVVGYRRTNGFTIYADASETVAYFVVRR